MKLKSESEVIQSCPTLHDPRDCILPGSSVHGNFQQEYWSGLPLSSPSYVLLTLNVDFLPLSLAFLLVLVIRLPIVQFRDYYQCLSWKEALWSQPCGIHTVFNSLLLDVCWAVVFCSLELMGWNVLFKISLLKDRGILLRLSGSFSNCLLWEKLADIREARMVTEQDE